MLLFRNATGNSLFHILVAIYLISTLPMAGAEEKKLQRFSGVELNFDKGKTGTLIEPKSTVSSANGKVVFTVNGNGCRYIKGPVKTAIHMDNGSFLSADNNPALNPGPDDFSIETWFKLDKGERGGYILVKRFPRGGDWYSLSVGKRLNFSFGRNAIDYCSGQVGYNLNNGLWHHLAVCVQRTSDTHMYIDGEFVKKMDVSNQKNTNITNKAQLMVGGWVKKGFYTGAIDGLRLTPGALSAKKVAERYLQGDPTAGGTAKEIGTRYPSEIKSDLWKFSEGKGNVATASNGNKATLKNIIWEKTVTGYALSFAEKKSRLLISAKEFPDKKFTVNAWVYMSEIKNGLIFGRRGCFDFYLRNFWLFAALKIYGKNGGKCAMPYTYGPYINCHRWTMLTASVGNGEARIFVNGTGCKTVSTGTLPQVNTDFVFGGKFRGELGELRIFPEALSANEVRLLYKESEKEFRVPLLKVEAIAIRGTLLARKLQYLPVLIMNRVESEQKGCLTYVIVEKDPKTKKETVVKEGKITDIVLKTGANETLNILMRDYQPGQYKITFYWNNDRKLPRHSNLRFITYPKHQPVSKTAELKNIKLIASFDPDQDYSADRYYEVGGTRVVKSPIGVYREALTKVRRPRFGYRFKADLSKPHLLEVEYPDDKIRTILITDMQSNNLDIGIATGELESPLTHKMQKLKALFYPQRKDTAVVFMGWNSGCPPAVGKVRIYEINQDLPRIQVNTPPDGGRIIGHMWEDQAIGLSYGLGALKPHEKTSDSRIGEYLNYTGNNLLRCLAWWYGGAYYKTITQERIDSIYSGDLAERALSMGNKGCYFQPSWHLLTWPKLLKNANYDEDSVRKGTPTINQVMNDGKVKRNTGQWNQSRNIDSRYGVGPVFNPVDPFVRKNIIDIFTEANRICGSLPGFIGAEITWWAPTTLWFGSLQQGYGDVTISLFEQETDIKIPVDQKDPERFSQRYSWLMKNQKQQWIDWRCQKITALISDIADALRKNNPGRSLTLSFGIDVLMANSRYKEWLENQSITFEELMKEGGLDLRTLGQLNEIVLELRGGFSGEFRRSRQEEGYRKHIAYTIEVLNRDSTFKSIFRDARQTSFWAFIPYYEWFDYSPPFKKFWWKKEFKNHGGAMRSGIHVLQPYARALGDFDVTFLGMGGILNPTPFAEDLIRNFALAFRALPRHKFSEIPGKTNPAVVRQFSQTDSTWFYIINREFYPVEVELKTDFDNLRLYDAATGELLPLSDKDLKFQLAGYQLLAFRISGKGKIITAQTTVAKQWIDWLKIEFTKRKKLSRKIKSLCDKQEISSAYDQTLEEIETAISAGDWVKARDLMTGGRISKGLNEIYLNNMLIKREARRAKIRSLTAENIKIDGSLDDWGQLPLKIKSSHEKNDLTVDWDLRHDKGGLYMAVKVKDQTHYQKNSGITSYFGDSVQFIIDGAMDEKGRIFGINGVYPMMMALSPNGAIAGKEVKGQTNMNFDENLDGITYKITRSDEKKETYYEMFFPYHAITPVNKETKKIRFNLLVNDNDGKGRKYIEYVRGIGDAKDTSFFPEINFK